MKILDRVPCIYYSVQFQKYKHKDVLALFNFRSEVNAINLVYTAQLDLKVQKTNIYTQKIDGSLLETNDIVIAAFQVLDKLGYS